MMKTPMTSFRFAALAVVATALLAASSVAAADGTPSAAESFASENDVAMKKMMDEMHVPLTGDVDRDFIVMMIPHHQGAIDMCAAQVRYGSNEELKELCRGIIAGQGREIEHMRKMLAAMPPASAAEPSSPSPSSSMPATHDHHSHSGM